VTSAAPKAAPAAPEPRRARAGRAGGAQVTRFAAPLAYNCLHVIRMHEYLPQGRRTVFAQKMSPAMADVPVFGADFNTWFPLTTGVYCLLLCAAPPLPPCVHKLRCWPAHHRRLLPAAVHRAAAAP